MAFGYFNLPYKSIVLSYDDENTPISLSGKKMLPIALMQGEVHTESLNIISTLDLNNELEAPPEGSSIDELDKLTSSLGKEVHSLAMPYWIWTPEFSSKSRYYFQKKKERKRGSFSTLFLKRSTYLVSLSVKLTHIEKNVTNFYKSDIITLADILIASHLWGMYIVPEFQFSSAMHRYLQRVSRACNFNYHEDFWN